LVPIGCKKPKALVAKHCYHINFGSKADIGWHFGRKSEARYSAARSNQLFFRAPHPLQSKSLPKVIESLQH